MNPVLRVALAGTLCVVISAMSALADGPKAPPIDPEAKARLDALIASYRALQAYADHGEVKLVVKVGDRELKQSQKASISFARPNKLDVETDLVRVVSDGTNVTSSVVPLKKYFVSPTPKRFAESALRSGPLGSIEFGGLSGLPLVHVLSLVIGDNPERLIYDFSPKVLVEPDQMIEGVAYKVLRLDESDNHDWRFLIDPKTGLISFVDLVVEGDATRSSIVGGDTHVESLRWTAGAISTEVPAAESFVFKPVAGFTLVSKLEGALAKPKPEVPDHPLVGKPAPDFSLTVLPFVGQYNLVKKDQLAGKVVLIDFWATWCGPCLTELPDIQKLIKRYEGTGGEVAVVALSIDQSEKGDLDEARDKVVAKLKELELTLTSVEPKKVGMIALDPLGKIAEAYGVQAIPFVVLIDQKGVVQAVHVGVTEASVLIEEIDTLLAGKKIGR